MKRLIILMGLIISISNLSLKAQVDMNTTGQGGVDLKQTGQTTMNFLQVGVSARAAGLGNAYTALSKGVESVFYNPAGLTEMNSQFEACVSTTQWFADIKYLAGAVAWNANEYGALALSFVVVDYGTIKGTRLVAYGSPGADNYELTGNVPNVGAYSFGLTYVKKISDKFSIGGTAKYVGQQLGQLTDESGNVSDNKHSRFAFDAGVKYFPGIESLRLGMAIRNFSTFANYGQTNFSSPLPLTFSVGAAMNVMDLLNKDISIDHSLMLSTEFIHPNNYTDRVNTGIEYTFMNMFSVRGGYESNHDILSWAGGVGVKQTIEGIQFEINYSYSKAKYFDSVNRFAVNIAF
jgi:hypothetical protein